MSRKFFVKKDNEVKNVLHSGADEVFPENGETEIEMLRRENEHLKRIKVCSELGIPSDAAVFVCALTDMRTGGEDVPFEEEAAAVWDELCSCFEKFFAEKKRAEGRYITTGVRGSKAGSGKDDSLRRAFGLK